MGTPSPRGRRFRHALISVVLVGLAVLPVAPASAQDLPIGHEDPVEGASADVYAPTPLAVVTKKGGCSGPSNWTLVLRKGSGKIRIAFTVRGGPSGKKWSVFMDRNGSGIFAGSRTSGDNGVFTAKQTINDRSGIDKILAGADSETGETCVGRGSI